MKRHKISVLKLHEAVMAQGVSKDDIAFICPMCKCVQSPRDFYNVGAGTKFEDVQAFLNYSCVGRWISAGSPREKPDGAPCNWTLGGMLQMHTLEVVDDDGNVTPSFEPASARQALQHALDNDALDKIGRERDERPA